MNKIKLGLENALSKQRQIIQNKRLGLICNQASVNHEFKYSVDLLTDADDLKLIILFSPQHGIRGDVQDNMVETNHSIDWKSGLKIYSLYGETREPTAAMMQDVDAVIFDLQDVGCRVYTFIYTLANTMRACAAFGKQMIVFDRPNPINGIKVEGNILEIGHESFVGQYAIAMRHGMTVGELAGYFNEEFSIGCDLEVIRMSGWQREFYADETDAPWVMPSPNMPTVNTACVFPATVFFEGTQISEGRGTTRPFEIIGAPYVDADSLADALNDLKMSGVYFRPIGFLPTFQKFGGQVCQGVFIHIINRDEFDAVLTGLMIVKVLLELYPAQFAWKVPPYEYVFDRNPFDVIAGTDKIRTILESGATKKELENVLQINLADFIRRREKYLLY